jgi:hypothetical protein
VIIQSAILHNLFQQKYPKTVPESLDAVPVLRAVISISWKKAIHCVLELPFVDWKEHLNTLIKSYMCAKKYQYLYTILKCIHIKINLSTLP